MHATPLDLNLFFDNPSPDFTKYCSLYNIGGSRDIIPNLNSDFKECFAAYVGVAKMKPKKELVDAYVTSVAWGIYNSVNMSHQNLSAFLLGGVLSKMVDAKRFSMMRDYWTEQLKSVCASFPIHSNTLKLVDTVIARGQSTNVDLNYTLRSNINDVLYVCYFIRCQALKELTADYFVLLAKELMSPQIFTVHRLEKFLKDPNLPNQLVLRLGSTFLVLENEDRITVSRSIIIVGDAATENHVSMIAISNPIEFTSQATLSRVHILKPRGMDFSVYFNYENGLVGKCLVSGVVLEGGGIHASNLEEFAVVNSLIHDCNVAVYAKKVDYLFVGDRDAPSQTLLAASCVQAVQAEEVGSLTVANIMFQDVGGVFFVGPCSMMEVNNVSVLDCGRLGVAHCASPVTLASCSISCLFPNLETRGHGARYSMVSLRSDSSFSISDVPVLCMPMTAPVKLSFQPDPLVKRQRIQIDVSDYALIKKMYKEEGKEGLPATAPTLMEAGLFLADTFNPEITESETKKQKVNQ